MSIKQMTMVFEEQKIKGNTKLLMLSLADNANDSGVCFPSWSTLITRTCMSRGAISTSLKKAEELGMLFRVTRNRKNGSKTSNKFLVYPHINRKNLDEEDFLIFEELFIEYDQSSETELAPIVQKLNYHSSETELPNGGQSSETELLEPSLSFNHHSNRHLVIVDDLNSKANSNYRATSSKTISLIEARLKEGFKEEDFFYVHTVKCSEWLGDPKMEKFLRPETLYGTKFEGYLNTKIRPKSSSNSKTSTSDLIKEMYGIGDVQEEETVVEAVQIL